MKHIHHLFAIFLFCCISFSAQANSIAADDEPCFTLLANDNGSSFSIKLTETINAEEDITVQVFSIEGKLVEELILDPYMPILDIDLKDLTVGAIYIINVVVNGQPCDGQKIMVNP